MPMPEPNRGEHDTCLRSLGTMSALPYVFWIGAIASCLPACVFRRKTAIHIEVISSKSASGPVSIAAEL